MRRRRRTLLGLDAGQPVVRGGQHAVEGAGGDGAGRVGRVRPLRVPETAVAPGASPPDRKGKRVHATKTQPVSSSFPSGAFLTRPAVMVPVWRITSRLVHAFR